MSRQYKSSDEVPNEVLAARLRELADFITKPSKRDDERLPSEFYMRIPAEVDHDADLVMSEAARRLLAAPPVHAGEDAAKILRQYSNDMVRIRQRLSDVRWRDAGHHCESKSAVHAVIQMTKDIEARIIPQLEKSTPSASAPVEVTEEMVQRGRIAAAAAMGHPHLDHIHSDVIRTIIAAALKGKP